MAGSLEGHEDFVDLHVTGTTLNVSPTGDSEGGDPGHVVISAFPSATVRDAVGRILEENPGIDVVSAEDVSGPVAEAVSDAAEEYGVRLDGAGAGA